MAGTVGRADIYGLPSSVGNSYDPVSIMNPNGSAVSPPATQTASGGAIASDNQPAIGLMSIIIAVALLRLAIHVWGER